MFTVFENSGKTKTNEQMKSLKSTVHTKVLTFEKTRRTIKRIIWKVKKKGWGQLLDWYDFAFFEIDKVCF